MSAVLPLVSSAAYGAAVSAPGKAGAIVVLTGGKGRVEKGLELLRGGSSDILILSGVNEDADVDAIYQARIDDGTKKKIVLEKESSSTLENAEATARILKGSGITRIILITSWYHENRALFIFKMVLPPDIAIEPVIIPPQHPDDERWGGFYNNPHLAAPELIKYIWYRVKFGGR